MTLILVNGELMPADKPILTVDERGFRFGDGLFETIGVYGGMTYLWNYHIERLTLGLKALRIDCPLGQLRKEASKLIEANQVQDGILRISISRGSGSRGYLPLENIKPTVVLETLARPAPPENGVILWRSSYEKISPRALPTHSKTAQGLTATLARMEAADNGAYEALQCDAKGHIAEASSANIFFLADGVLHTPSLETGALSGVTRRRMMELSPYPVEEGFYTVERLRSAEAVILTNTVCGCVAAASLQPDGRHWNSTALAKRLNALRLQDIELLA